ncbi:hypothetical protein, partial [Paraclostridium sordellii]|uniref:hypothetical protein n=1 Tax=Paraclostridium sordellii TaxID=1505 RepID=UPI0006583D8C
KDINTVDKLREAGNKYLNNLVKDMPSIKVKFVDKENLNEFENVSQLQTLDLYDTVIVRYISLGINYKTKINKVVYDVLKEEYEEIELGEKRTNLASSLNDTDKNIKDEIKNNIDFVKQVIEHATSQITGNSGGHVMLWPPDKPSEIFFMDTDNPSTARNVLRINREGIGFSNNGINGPFRTAWTSDGTFYADFITAGILTAISIQNADGSLQIDLSGRSGIEFLKNGVRAIEIAGQVMKFFDWDGIGDPVAEIFSSRLGGDENKPGLMIGNTKEGFVSIGYRDEHNPKTYPKYMLFDIHNLSGEAPHPIMLYENMCLNSRCLYLDQYDNKGIYSSATQNFILRSKKSFIFVDQNNKSIFEIDPINKKINIFNDAVYSYLPIGNKHNKIDNSSNDTNKMLLGGNYKTTIGAWNDSNSLDGKIEVSGNLIESFSHWDFNNWTLRNAYIESPRISIKENNPRTKSVLEKRIVETITPNTEYIGEGEVINGTCKIDLNLPIQGIGSQYYVQLTPIGKNKKVELIEKTNSYFIVEGDDCKFDYLLKVKHPKKPSRLKTRETKNNIIKAKEHKTSEFSREQTKLPYWMLYTKNKIK